MEISMEQWWSDNDRGDPEPLCALSILQGLTWDGTRSSAVACRRLTAPATAPHFEDYG